MTPPELTAVVAGVTLVGGVGGWFLKSKLNGSSKTRHSSDEIAFRAETRLRLQRLTDISEKVSDTNILTAQVLAKLSDMVADHDERTAKAISTVDRSHQMIKDIHRKVVE